MKILMSKNFSDDYFVNRRTIRRYSTREVSLALIDELLEKASHAPTTGNMQLYSVIVTADAEGKRCLAPAHFNQPTVEGCSVLLTFCADFNRFVKWCEASGAVPGYDNFQSFMTAVLDTALFAQQFNTLAELEGLGCCYLGTTTYNAPQIAEALKLPKLVVPVTTLTVGYPEGGSEVSDRLGIDAIRHIGSYSDYTAENVKEFYAEKEAREDSRRFVEENHKDSLAQVFTDVRYTREANELFSKIYADFIEESGFGFPKD